MDSILDDDAGFDQDQWDDISDDAVDLTARLLIKNRDRRITMEEALCHNWFKSEIKITSIEKSLSIEFVDKMRKYRKNSKLKKISMNVFFKFLPSNEKKD